MPIEGISGLTAESQQMPPKMAVTTWTIKSSPPSLATAKPMPRSIFINPKRAGIAFAAGVATSSTRSQRGHNWASSEDGVPSMTSTKARTTTNTWWVRSQRWLDPAWG